jgi:hypothetical protein
VFWERNSLNDQKPSPQKIVDANEKLVKEMKDGNK